MSTVYLSGSLGNVTVTPPPPTYMPWAQVNGITWMLPHRHAIIHGVRRGKCRVLFDGWVIERPVPEAK